MGEFHTNPVHLDLKEGAVPKHHKPFPVAKIHEDTLKKELERLCKIGVLRKSSRRPYPIPKIADILQKLEGMRYATSLDLNMGYYTVCLDPDSQKLCTIITPWGKYQYLRLPMGVNVLWVQ